MRLGQKKKKDTQKWHNGPIRMPNFRGSLDPRWISISTALSYWEQTDHSATTTPACLCSPRNVLTCFRHHPTLFRLPSAHSQRGAPSLCRIRASNVPRRAIGVTWSKLFPRKRPGCDCSQTQEVESRDCTCLGRRVSGSPLETLETHWFDRLVSDVEIEPQLGEIDYCL